MENLTLVGGIMTVIGIIFIFFVTEIFRDRYTSWRAHRMYYLDEGLPADLRKTCRKIAFKELPFVFLYVLSASIGMSSFGIGTLLIIATIVPK